MIFQNANTFVFRCLQEKGYFMYHIPSSEPDYNVYSVPTGRILSMSYDIVVVYNMDKRVPMNHNPRIASLIPFKIVNIDINRNVFALPIFIDDHVIDLIRASSPEALNYADDNTCQAVSLALSSLFNDSLHRSDMVSSFSQLAIPVQETIEEMPVKEKNNCYIFNSNGIEYTEGKPVDSYDNIGVTHSRPLEDMQAMFDPAELGVRGRFKAGYDIEEPLPFDEIPPGTRPAALTMEDIKDNDNVRAVISHPIRFNGYKLYPTLLQVVDIVPEEERVKTGKNPIGYIEDK